MARSPIFWISGHFLVAFVYAHYFLLPALRRQLSAPLRPADPCAGRYLFVHPLPPRFNSDILSDCGNGNPGTDVCNFASNSGLGPTLNDTISYSGIGPALNDTNSSGSWFHTDQFSLDVIFHNRLRNYQCLTHNSSAATVFFIPYYAGLDFARHQWGYNSSVRDALAVDMAKWLSAQPEWTRMGGKDHFLIAGRTTWDFRRPEEHVLWGNKLFLLRQTSRMTVLTVEAATWESNDISVPYPTYFHPATADEVSSWQERVLYKKRKWLFSFIGAPRPGQNDSIRGQVIEQCRASERCNLLDCGRSPMKCHSPSSVMKVFQRSSFCLQPRGDSATRRSVFDAMVAGCVPVLFHPDTAYSQYKWHLPEKKDSYSVMIAEEEVRTGKVSIEEVLSKYGEEEVRNMREEVVRTIPKLVYADPKASNKGFDDAVDVAVAGVLQRVARFQEEMKFRKEVGGRVYCFGFVCG